MAFAKDNDIKSQKAKWKSLFFHRSSVIRKRENTIPGLV